MEPDLKARMSPGLKGREMTLGLFCSHSFSEKEVLIRAHLRHNSLAQMMAKKQTHNCCEWEQESQEGHVRSFPCEQCSVRDAHQQSQHCLNRSSPTSCLRDLLPWSWGWNHGCGMGEEIERKDSTGKRKCLENITGVGRNSTWRQSITRSADTWALEQFENSYGNPSCSPRGNLKWDFKAQHPQALKTPPGRVSGHFLPLHPSPFPWGEPSHSLPGGDISLAVTPLSDPSWFPSTHPKGDHAPGPTEHQPQNSMNATYGEAGNQKGPLVCLTWLGNHRPSDSTRVLHPANRSHKISWSSQDCNVSVRIWEWNGLILSSGRKELGRVVPLWHHQATCNSLWYRKAKWIKVLVPWSEDKTSFEPQMEYSLWPSASQKGMWKHCHVQLLHHFSCCTSTYCSKTIYDPFGQDLPVFVTRSSAWLWLTLLLVTFNSSQTMCKMNISSFLKTWSTKARAWHLNTINS